jgi:hypothetical protein
MPICLIKHGSHDAYWRGVASTSGQIFRVLDRFGANNTLEQHLLLRTKINSRLLSDPRLLSARQMDRALDEIVAERHVSPSLCYPFQPCAGGYG